MNDYISREAALNWNYRATGLSKETASALHDAISSFLAHIKGVPAADVRPVIGGHWLTWEEQFPTRKVPKKSRLGVFCSECRGHADNMTDFCPNCGADMRKAENETD